MRVVERMKKVVVKVDPSQVMDHLSMEVLDQVMLQAVEESHKSDLNKPNLS